MKKQLLAAAIVGALAAPAFAADSPVIIYGIINTTYAYADNFAFANSNTVKQSRVDAGNTGSRIGFKGEEALDGSLKAFFQLETGIRADDANSGLFGSREAWVGLNGDFGKIGLGRGKTPYTNLADIFDINNGIGDLEMYTEKNGLVGFQSSRFNNAIRYDSPNFSGFSGSVMYGAGENKTASAGAVAGVDATENWDLAGRFEQGPILAAIAYNSEKNVGATPVDGSKNHAWLLTGTYKIMDNFKVGLSYQNAVVETKAVRKERNYGDAIAIFSIDKLDLRGGVLVGSKIKWNNKVAGVSNTVDGTKTVRYTLGAQYNLSKRTAAYVEYNGDNFDKDANGTSVGLNAAKNANVTTTDKADFSALNIGIIHKF